MNGQGFYRRRKGAGIGRREIHNPEFRIQNSEARSWKLEVRSEE